METTQLEFEIRKYVETLHSMTFLLLNKYSHLYIREIYSLLIQKIHIPTSYMRVYVFQREIRGIFTLYITLYRWTE